MLTLHPEKLILYNLNFMKKLFTLFTLVALFAFATMAQVKLYVHQNDGSYTEFIAATVDSITFSEQKPGTITNNGYQWVDMGLPSGLLWATCNLGANKPTDFGDYFAWGETETKESYTPKTYKWYEGTNSFYIMKYGVLSIPDESGFIQTLLELEDDAAYVKLGGNWRMPTIEEFEELLDSRYTNSCLINKNNVKGYLIVSKKNGNTIFLPAAGYKDANDVRFLGKEFYYFTSSLTEEELSDVKGIGESDGRLEKFFYDRTIGGTIRPVLAKTLDYTIRFKANGAEGEMTDIDAKYAETISLPTCTYTKADEQFKGWNTKANGTGISYKENQLVTITEDITLYAMWGSKYGYVDLGLPSGILWASCNIGAEKPEDYGDYFAWGMVEPEGKREGDLKNVTSNHLELINDAARYNWGGKWRIPSDTEINELIDECEWTWTTLNGIVGYEVKGPNGNTIFLPAAGSDTYNKGEMGYYRGNLRRGQTFTILFSEKQISAFVEMHFDEGYSIRPVCNKTDENFTLSFDANSGEGSMESISLEYGEYKFLPLPSFTKEGYVSVSWNTEADGSGTAYTNKSQISLTENTTLYAIWEESVSISFDANGGSNTMLPMYIPINKESTLVSNVFKKEGFTFMSWNTKADGTGIVYVDKSTITSTENITLYAQWNQSTYHNGYEYVDLGLSVKWATCNVGADSPYEYGDYYAWGEVETKSTFIPSDYNSTNNSTVLSFSYDAANANWGGEWRTPSVTEYRELMNSDNCTWVWTDKGCVVISKKNGNSIFLPASGYRYSRLLHAGVLGLYWSNSSSGGSFANHMHIQSGYTSIGESGYYSGLTVRPVLP